MPPEPTLHELLSQECDAMVRYLLSAGKRCPPALVRAVERARSGGARDTGALAAAHGQLARLAAPAIPATLLMLDRRTGRWRTLGSVELVRQLMVTTLLLVAAFVGLSLLRYVGDDAHGVARDSGLALLANELFWMASAGLGASFALLYQLNQYVTRRTYDAAHAPGYWVRLLLGIVAGFILVTVLPLPALDPGATVGSAAEAAHTFTKPLLAMLGGFSASAVYGILTRLVEAVENLFAGGVRERAELREARAVQRTSGEAAEARIAVAGRLVDVQRRLAAGAPPEELSGALQGVVDALVGGAPAEEEGLPALADA
jgi:hypothetical protein